MVKWDDIEKTITEHRGAFEADMPDSRQEDLFFQKVDSLHRKQVVLKRWQNIGYAASFAAFMVMSAAILWAYYDLNYRHYAPFTYNQQASEFNEARDYLASQIESGIEQIKHLPFNEPQQVDSIMVELSEMDKNSEQLYNELSLNPDDERVMNAIINVYMVKMDAINQVVRSFSMSHNNKIQQNESNI